MKRFSNSIGFVSKVAFGAAMAVSAISFAADKAPRLVDCDAPIQSYKRGICENSLSADDFIALAPGVSWYYNWHYETKDLPPAGVKMEYIPMCWGDTQDRLDGLDHYLDSHKPRAVLAINEPNLKGQAFIPPEETANLFKKIRAIADKHNVPVVGPNMALGSAANESISADDPIQNKKVTYTYMGDFLKPFFHYLGSTDPVETIGVHGYKDIGELTWMSGVLTKDFNKPVWVTEYAFWSAKNATDEMKYMVQATDLLERSPQVHGYSWFKERVGGNPKISIFEKASGQLTPLGKAYVNMPVHDADLYYKIPGKLASAKYVQMSDMKINPTDDAGGFLDMTADKAGAWCDYNVSADSAGEYVVQLRLKNDGEVDVLKGGQTLATAKSDGKDWQTITAKVQLAKGTQTIRVGGTQKGQVVEWMDFGKP